MIVKIDNLSHDFRGIARVNNKVTFVSDTLPGEIVDIKILNSKKNIDEAKVISYIETSFNRVKPICPYYDLCGGCDTSYVKYDKSLEYKKDIVCNIMRKYANIEVNPDIISDDNAYGYRNKVSLKVKDGKLALVKDGSNELVNISRCLLVNDNINKIIEIFDSINLDNVNEVIIRGTEDIMVIVNGDTSCELFINALKDNVSSIILNDEVIYGDDYITIKVKDFKYAVYPKSFFQVNTGMIEKLYDKVLEYSGKGKRLLDLLWCWYYWYIFS